MEHAVLKMVNADFLKTTVASDVIHILKNVVKYPNLDIVGGNEGICSKGQCCLKYGYCGYSKASCETECLPCCIWEIQIIYR